jgi:AcrR family transcriptional regulator
MRICKRPEERKREITEAAFELFLEKGYENVSVKDITTKVKVAAGLFHYYFHSKEEVLMEGVRLDRQRFIEELNAPGYLPEDISAIEKINILLGRAMRNLMQRQVLFKEVYNINSAMLMEQIKHRVLGVFTDKMTEFIIQGNNEGVFSCKYPKETAEIAVFGVSDQFDREQERNPSLKKYLLGEYVFIYKEVYLDIFMKLLNMKEPLGLLDIDSLTCDPKDFERQQPGS